MNPQSPNFYENYDDHLDYGRDSLSSESEREEKAEEYVNDMISEPEITVVKSPKIARIYISDSITDIKI